MKVYLVRFHLWSDLENHGRVLGVYSKRERAEQAIRSIGLKYAVVQEYRLGETDDSELPLRHET